MIKYAIALGSNLGDSYITLDRTIIFLSQYPNINLISYSPWYTTFPIGPKQPNYLNGCAILNSSINPEKLLEILRNIEDNFGRTRNEKWNARTLDLDILLCEDLIIETTALKIPHPLLIERKFVLFPLCTIMPNWEHPITGKTVQKHLQEISNENLI